MPAGTPIAAQLAAPFLRRARPLEMLRIVPRTAVFVYNSGHEHSNRAIPPLRRSVPTTALVLLDELVATLYYVTSGQDEAAFNRGLIELRDAEGLLTAGGWLGDPSSFHPPPPPPGDAKLVAARSFGISYEHLSFTSGYEPPCRLPSSGRWLADEANRVAHAYVLRHEGGPRPWLVVLHGHGAGGVVDLRWMGSLALHRELGINVIQPIMPQHGPRRGRVAPAYPGPDGLLNLHAFAHAIWDIRRTIAWLREQGTGAIGIHGLSLGGYTAALLAGLEWDLAVVIAGAPLSDIPSLLLRHASRYDLTAAPLGDVFEGAPKRVNRLISPLAFPPLVPKARRFIYAAVGDRISTPEQAVDLWRHWEEPAICWYQGSHIAAAMAREVREFVRGALVESGIDAERAA